MKGLFRNIILYARRRSCFRISTHRGGVANTARQASSACASASKLLDQEPSHHGQHKWRCLRANVATKERECKALKERIAAIEKRVATGDLFWWIRLMSDLPGPSTGSRRPPLPTRTLLDRLDNDLETVNRQQATITRNLAEARRVLVREAVSVFGLRKGSGKQKDWEIAGLPLPSPEAFRRESTCGTLADCSVSFGPD